MTSLKGQNLRILLLDDNPAYKVVGKSTNCTVTLTGNTDDVNSKDDPKMVSKPTVTSKSWSVQVDSLDVTDIAAILTAIKDMRRFTLMWDETATSNNQTAQAAAYARRGTAYLTDVTFNWNDRENATKSLQFTGFGPLEKVSSAPAQDIVVVDGAYTKGQFVRLFLADPQAFDPNKVIAAAKTLSMHVGMTLEDATTKDTTGDWQVQEPTALTWDISSNALVQSGDSITSQVPGHDLASIEDIFESSESVEMNIANVSGANNRTPGATIVSGTVIITQLKLNGPNRQSATYDTQFAGYGIYSVGI